MESKIIVSSGSKPLPGVDVWVIHPDTTGTRGTTAENGECSVNLYASKDAYGCDEPYAVYLACQGYAGYVKTDWQANEENPLTVELTELPDGGSCIIHGTGYIPGLGVDPQGTERNGDEGRLNPILDTEGRTYFYAKNLAIDGGKPQPVHFRFGEPVIVSDNYDNTVEVKFLDITGSVTILDWTRADIQRATP